MTQQGDASRKVLGKVSPQERDEIRALYERKNGLAELFRSMSGLGASELEASALYDRLVKDMGEVTSRFQAWWETTSRKYSWDNIPGYRWEIDFENCVVSLVAQ
jgi:CXXX repeat modification system protein